jgi:hypothetical protein
MSGTSLEWSLLRVLSDCIIHLSRISHYKPSSYWGTLILGGPLYIYIYYIIYYQIYTYIISYYIYIHLHINKQINRYIYYITIPYHSHHPRPTTNSVLDENQRIRHPRKPRAFEPLSRRCGSLIINLCPTKKH